MQTFTRMPTTIQAERFDGVHHPEVQYNSGTQQHYYGQYPIEAGDWLVRTPHGCKYPVRADSFEGLFNPLQTCVDGMSLLRATITAILDAGLHITGIDPAQVRVLTREEYLAQAQPRPIAELAPSGPKPPAPAGYAGDLSSCCGAPTEQKGTCHYCTSCGGSDGCS